MIYCESKRFPNWKVIRRREENNYVMLLFGFIHYYRKGKGNVFLSLNLSFSSCSSPCPGLVSLSTESETNRIVELINASNHLSGVLFFCYQQTFSRVSTFEEWNGKTNWSRKSNRSQLVLGRSLKYMIHNQKKQQGTKKRRRINLPT